jgi:hypothetical protein
MIAGLVGFAIANIPAMRQSAVGKNACFWIIVMAIIAFMTQRPSTFIWAHIHALQYLQFPAVRLHAAALMAVTYLICTWLGYYKEVQPLGGRAYHKVTLMLLVAIFGTATYLHIYDIYRPGAHWDVPAARATHLLLPPEYVTRWGCKNPFDALREYYDKKSFPLMAVAKGRASLTQSDWQPPQHIALQAQVRSAETVIRLHQCYTPLWTARDEKGASLPLSPDRQGLISLTLPHGTHTAQITLQPSPQERFARRISAMTLLICLAFLWWDSRKKPRNA